MGDALCNHPIHRAWLRWAGGSKGVVVSIGKVSFRSPLRDAIARNCPLVHTGWWAWSSAGIPWLTREGIQVLLLLNLETGLEAALPGLDFPSLTLLQVYTDVPGPVPASLRPVSSPVKPSELGRHWLGAQAQVKWHGSLPRSVAGALKEGAHSDQQLTSLGFREEVTIAIQPPYLLLKRSLSCLVPGLALDSRDWR